MKVYFIKSIFYLAVFTLLCATITAQTKPFPQTSPASYKSGFFLTKIPITNLNKPDENLNDRTLKFYKLWKAKYITKIENFSGCRATNQYVLFVNIDNKYDDDKKALTVSEAHGFGMLIIALMAQKGSDDQNLFDGMYNYFKAHQVPGKPYLMSWKQGKKCENRGGNGSATDGDMDIAYSLLLADKQWGSQGRINYLEEAKKVINAIMQYEIAFENNQNFIMLGSFQKEITDSKDIYKKNATRPSDFMPSHLKAFQTATGDSRWNQVIDEMYEIFERFQNNNSSKTGLISDVIEEANTNQPKQARKNFFDDEKVDAGAFHYNACRVPFRITIDYLMSGDPRALRIVTKMNKWIKSDEKIQGVPANIKNGYKLDGVTFGDGTSLSFSSPFSVMGMANPEDAVNKKYLEDSWIFIQDTPISETSFFGNSLKMMAMITMSGNWWNP